MRHASSAVAAIAFCFLPVTLVAQDGERLRIRATRRDTIEVQATVTSAFVVSSERDDSVQVMPHIEAPRDWTVLMGTTPVVVRARSSEIVMLSLVVPARAAAGVYVLRMWATTSRDPSGVMDSVMVRIPQRRALELGLISRPGFVVSGKTYDASFLLRNRGNVAAVITLSARSSLGVASMPDTAIRLAAEESRVIDTRVQTPIGLDAATDDVLEVAARVAGDTTSTADASSRVTIVPEPSRKIDAYQRVPTQVHMRAASSNGVSPFEVFGHGPIRDGGATQIDFLARGSAGTYSAFGERDEYRVELSAPSWRARAGDQLYMLSSLTGAAQPGFGAGVDITRGRFAVGGYGQQFRRVLEKGSETGGFVSMRPMPDARLAFNLVNRAGGFLSGRVGSAATAFDRGPYTGEVELARSQSSTGTGMARSARLSGSNSLGSYDVGHLYADTAFVGAQRGSEHDYLSASTQVWDAVSLAVNASTHRADLSRATGVPYRERFDIGTIAGTFRQRVTMELGAVTRSSAIQGVRSAGEQRQVRTRGDHDSRFGALSLEVEGGRAREPGSSARAYSDVSIGARQAFSRGGVGAWLDRYSGGSITKGENGTLTLGGDGSLHVGRATDLILMGYATRLRSQLPSWHSQLDAQVVHTLPNANTVALRVRLIGGGANLSGGEKSVAYLEYGLPLRLPVSRLRTPGRVYGRVIDAVTGDGVRGALVRLGPQVAITDDRGQVAFGGVPGGEHRVSMSQETSFADAVFVGDPTLRVDSTRTQPTTFELAIARSARVDVQVRRYVVARTSVGGGADSLADAGPLANATLMLAAGRDTLYRTTRDNGAVSFTDIPPGTWVVTIRGDAPAFHRFDADRLELILGPGETKAITFKLLPRKRDVQIIGDGQELRPMLAEPKGAAPATTTRTGKPNNRP